MFFIIPDGWIIFCAAIAVALLALFVMHLLGQKFVTRDVVLRPFGILDLQLASTEMEIDNTLQGIKKLEPKTSTAVFDALRRHLYADFLFMIGAYGALFVGCMQLAVKMNTVGLWFFTALAWMQVLALIADVFENMYLLKKIREHIDLDRPIKRPDRFSAYQKAEAVKWSLSSLATVCLLSALLYFWLSGYYSPDSLRFILVVVCELVLYFILVRFFKSKVPQDSK